MNIYYRMFKWVITIESVKIQDDEQETVKDRDWSTLKADVFSIDLEEGDF